MIAAVFQVSFVIFLVYFILLLAYYLFCGVVSLWEVARRSRQQQLEDLQHVSVSLFSLPVSVIIPTRNEEHWILDSVKATLANRYPEFEVIVVDDGSTDTTMQLLQQHFDLAPYYDHTSEQAGKLPAGPVKELLVSRADPRLRVVRKESGLKKAGAVNAGVQFARYPYFCMLDADTILEPDAILKVMSHVLRDPEHVVGVGSYFGLVNGLKVVDGRITDYSFSANPLVAYQNLEYLRSFIGTRTVWSKYNATPILAGGFSVWRKDLMVELGGFAPEYSSEDVEMTFRAQEYIAAHPDKGYQLLMLPYFVGWTEGPATLGTLLKQRNRWQRCLSEALWKYRHMIGNRRYGGFGLFTLPYLLLYEGLGVFFEVGSILLTLVGSAFLALDPRLLGVFILFIALNQAVISLFSLAAFTRDRQPFRPRFLLYLIVLSFLEIFWYRWLQVVAKVQGTVSFSRGVRDFDQYVREQRKRNT